MNIKSRFKLLKRSAEKRKISVNLNISIYSNLLDLGCIYCGSDLKESSGYGLDRIDNSKGYDISNVTPCCGICNRAKGSMNVSEFISWIKKANNFTNKKLQEIQDVFYTEKEIKKMENIILNNKNTRNSETLYIKGNR